MVCNNLEGLLNFETSIFKSVNEYYNTRCNKEYTQQKLIEFIGNNGENLRRTYCDTVCKYNKACDSKYLK